MNTTSYSFLHECYPLPKDSELRAGQIREIVQFIQREGKTGASQLKLAVATLATSFSDNAAVQKLAKSLEAELAQYKGPEKEKPHREQRKKSQKR